MDLAYIVFVIEIVAIFVAILSIVIVRIIRNIQEHRTKQRRDALRKIFTHALQNNQLITPAEIPKALNCYLDLIVVLETFDRLFLGALWIQTKEVIIDKFLLKQAVNLLKSSSWRNNLLGLRCIALDAKRLIKTSHFSSLNHLWSHTSNFGPKGGIVIALLNHAKFIVRQLAAICLIRTEDKKLIHHVVNRMVEEYPMAQYPYRDQFIQGNTTTMSILEELAEHEKNPKVIAALLDILSARLTGNLVPLAAKYRNSPDDNCRLAAIKIFASIPGEASEVYLSEALNDPNEINRAEAAKGLGKIVAVKSIPALVLALRDKSWALRLQAAIALKSMGALGKAALFEQDQYAHPEAYKAARFVLSIP